MSAAEGLKKWHVVIDAGSDPAALAAIIRDDAVFHSPVVHTPQVGKPIVVAYLSAAGQTLGNDSFTYVRELVDGENAMLEFTTEMEGIQVNGIDLIRFDEDGMIADFKVMVRPLKAVNKVWEMMAAQLERQKAG
ncbi:nuclear transport factor 2 family protein [Altererythrobacter arenosus]|uniref:Nuclear transport factor 2 family protein n=1 Tax=Altererythrobacter arenosus TaxID=3032592 RepID=A0ABY8FUH7_9SPHN|nr:nuclear transport factor 2 family protein [Altererythrobacter sp. CAU 1644]WFL78657.1 nuclear transport factor 2 family protein [Altererythrobacter sp. CAU 1644]